MMTNADLFEASAPPRPNVIPESYLDRFNSRSKYIDRNTGRDDFAEMPWYLQRFVRSICNV